LTRLPRELCEMVFQYAQNTACDVQGRPIRSITGVTPTFARWHDFHWYVTDNSSASSALRTNSLHQIVVFDENWNIIRKFGAKHLSSPNGIAILLTNKTFLVFVTDSNRNNITVFDATGSFLRTFGSSGNLPGQFNCPCSLLEHQGLLYVADRHNHRIQVMSALDGVFVRSIGSYLEFAYPYDIAIYDQELYVSDNGHHRIQVFSLTGALMRSIGFGKLEYPRGIIVTDAPSGSSSRLVVVENGLDRVHLFDCPQDSSVRMFGSRGKELHQTMNAMGLAYGNGVLAVCDTDNGRIVLLA